MYGPKSVAPGKWNDLPDDGYEHNPLPRIVELALASHGEIIARWDFDEPGGQTILDSSPHKLDGFLGSAPEADPFDPLRIPGLDGSPGALRTAGKGYAQVPHSALLQPTGSLTVRALIRPSVDEQFGRVLCNLRYLGGGNRYSGYDLDLQRDHLRFAIFSEQGQENYIIAAFDFRPAIVYEVAGSWNQRGNLMHVFVDGIRISVPGNVEGSWHTTIAQIGPNQGNLFIGATSFGPSEFFQGDLDRVIVDTTPLIRAGDLNCDGAVNNFDIDPFVLALTVPSRYVVLYPDCAWRLADVNGDGFVDNFDIDPFVELLTKP